MKLTKKIWEVKLSIPKIKKASKGFKFKYANLDAIEKALKPKLVEAKIGYAHHLEIYGESNILVTTIFNLENDESQTHKLVIPQSVQLAGMNDYQSLGSALTYFRRYHLVTAFGIITDEDVDAITTQVKTTPIKHVEKIKQLIEIGRAKSTLMKYFDTYKGKMNEQEKAEIQQLILDLKK